VPEAEGDRRRNPERSAQPVSTFGYGVYCLPVILDDSLAALVKQYAGVGQCLLPGGTLKQLGAELIL